MALRSRMFPKKEMATPEDDNNAVIRSDAGQDDTQDDGLSQHATEDETIGSHPSSKRNMGKSLFKVSI